MFGNQIRAVLDKWHKDLKLFTSVEAAIVHVQQMIE